jgi:hypothetical protein
MRRLVIITLALAGVAMATNPKTIDFIRPPGFVQEGEKIPFKVRIPPHEDNRRVEIAAFDQADGERVSFTYRELSGAGAAALLTIDLILPRGQLLLVGQLWGIHGLRGKVTTPVRVRGRLGDPDDLDEEPDAR